MTATPSRNGTVLASNTSSGTVGTRRRGVRWKIPADAAAGLVLLGLALVLHLAQCHPEGTWVVELPAGVTPETASADAHATPLTGTLRLEPSGQYTLETVGPGAPIHANAGTWASNLEGFELHEVPCSLNRIGALASPLARMRADGTAELTFLDGRTLHLRRTHGD